MFAGGLVKKELFLLRHGKSSWETQDEDFHRPLADRGKRCAQRMGVWLVQQSLQPDRVLCSPAERAKITAEKMLKAMGLPVQTIIYDDQLYGASLDDLIQVILKTPKACQRLMIVGHNPGLESLLHYLSYKDIALPEDGKLLPTATLAHLKLTKKWKRCGEGCGRLVSVTRPKALPKTFPFPMPDGAEQRIRPAYYYHQSSVIPFRLNEGKLQVLLISSSKNKHFVVPKGIKEPGLSPQESAAREAWEEAGVEGQVDEQHLGVYSYTKWDALCQVWVYPMMVTRVLDADEWEESHRGRQWMSLSEAADKVEQKALQPIILLLDQYVAGKPL